MTDESIIEAIGKLIEPRRQDQEFMQRLRDRIEQYREALEAIKREHHCTFRQIGCWRTIPCEVCQILDYALSPRNVSGIATSTPSDEEAAAIQERSEHPERGWSDV